MAHHEGRPRERGRHPRQGQGLRQYQLQELIADTDAVLDGGIIADDVVILGRTAGKIDARRVRFEKTAVVNGEIIHEVFSVEEGARINGAVRQAQP